MRYFLFVLSLLTFISCSEQKKEVRKYMQDAYVESRLDKYEEFKRTRCIELIEVKVKEQVEKDIKEKSRELTNEDFDIFNKPSKPTKPVIKEVSDSLKLAPIISDSIID